MEKELPPPSLKDLLVRGQVVHETKETFSVPLLDSSFNHTSTLTTEIQKYTKSLGYDIDEIEILTIFRSQLKRENTEFNSNNVLYITKDRVEDKDIHIAYYLAKAEILKK